LSTRRLKAWYQLATVAVSQPMDCWTNGNGRSACVFLPINAHSKGTVLTLIRCTQCTPCAPEYEASTVSPGMNWYWRERLNCCTFGNCELLMSAARNAVPRAFLASYLLNPGSRADSTMSGLVK